MHWWRAFSMSVGLTEPMNASVDPGPIDNGELEDDNSLCISKQNVSQYYFALERCCVPERHSAACSAGVGSRFQDGARGCLAEAEGVVQLVWF